MKTFQIFDRNVVKRQSQPKIEPYYEINQPSNYRIQSTGYKLSTIDGKVIIEKTPGYGMFD